MKPLAETFQATDPNFPNDGPTAFVGIPLTSVFKLAAISIESGVTIIAKDQYVGYLPTGRLDRFQPYLVWQMNGRSISTLKGGPLKIVYPDRADAHGSCYTWYVDTLVSGTIKPSSFKLTVEGRVSHVRTDRVAAEIRAIDHRLFSVPAGCRIGLASLAGTKKIQAVFLKEIIGFLSVEDWKQVTLIPFSGSAIKLDKSVLEYPVYITLNCNGQPIHPSFGGPFSVIFPIEEYPALKSIVPESGALFFLEEIRID